MIPLWLKLLWGTWLLATWLMSAFSLSGLLVIEFDKQKGNRNRTIEIDVNKSFKYMTIMWFIVAISFVVILSVYKIPYYDWIGCK